MLRIGRVYVTPALDTSAYASGDQVSTLQTLTICEPHFGTRLVSLTILDKQQRKSPMDLFFFDASVTVASDNSAAAISDADMAHCLGVVNVLATDFDDMAATSSVATINFSPSFPLLAADHSKNVYMAIVARGAPTYAVSDLVFGFSCMQDGE